MTPERYRQIRESLGWTRIEMARRTGVSAETIYNFESRKAVPTDRTMRRLLAAIQAAGLDVIALTEQVEGAGRKLGLG